MKYLILILTLFIFQGCTIKHNESLTQNKLELNFINHSEHHLEDITIYSYKTKRKLYFNYLVKNATNKFFIYKNIESDSKIILSWRDKNQVFNHSFYTKNSNKYSVVNFHILKKGEYKLSFF